MSDIVIPTCPNPKVPAPKAPLVHLTSVQLRFNDIDMLGHLNNGAYLELFDLAKTEFLTSIIGHPLDWRDAVAVIVNINCSFFAQAFYGEPLAVLTGVQSVSTHSFILEQRMVNTATGAVNCIATTVMVAFDHASATSAELTPEWREALTRASRSTSTLV
ncbi:MAG: acyl-CoA thioesterase [Muribaculaceae bacterium]|nr:acyl-CoA thioesterase [Muribaculaceae bacterium]